MGTFLITSRYWNKDIDKITETSILKAMKTITDINAATAISTCQHHHHHHTTPRVGM